MEIPVMVDALRIPGLVARLLADLTGAWASVVLLVAGFATFLGFLGRVQLALVRYGRARSVVSLSPCYCSSGDDDDDDDCDADSESPSEEEDEEPSSPSSDEYECAFGSYGEDWSRDGGLEQAMGGAVVRTWEGLGLGFDRAGGLISLVDLNRGDVLRSFLPQAASLASPAVVLSAAEGAAAVRVWDARAAGERMPAACAEWRSLWQRRVVGVVGGNGKVYVGDDDGVITAADLRRGRSPLVVEAWRGRRFPLLPSPT